MATIVQDYGPIYGEAVNGTVQGRPNGSVYVPSSNTIEITINPAAKLYRVGVAPCPNCINVTNDLSYVAVSQDLSSYVSISIYEDAECTTQFGLSRNLTAGIFNGIIAAISSNTTAPTTGVSYYIRAQLINNGVAVATSNTLEVEGQ